LKSDTELEVVGEAGNGRETFRQVEDLLPDVVLLDIGMPGEDGIQVAKRLKARFPQLRVLFLTMHEDEGLLREAIAVGAAGYIIKRADDSEIINAIHAAHRGELYVHPAMTRALVQPRAPERPGAATGDTPLTRREVEILKLLARGHTNRQIADALSLSVRTVEGHRSNLMGKLGLSSRVELVTYAEKHGLL
jgi:two-component system response regulator NreC